MTNAKKKFDKAINRCEELIKIYQVLEDNQVNEESVVRPKQDILRAAIVLVVAAFDSYATDCFSELFVVYIKIIL